MITAHSCFYGHCVLVLLSRYELEYLEYCCVDGGGFGFCLGWVGLGSVLFNVAGVVFWFYYLVIVQVRLRIGRSFW